MQPTLLAAFFEFSRTAFSMSAAALALLLIGLLAAKNDIAQARGLDKIVALTNLCFAIPLAAFGAEHLSGAKFLMELVPSYMPWRLFWAYFVGFALIAASLSIGTKTHVRWSGLLLGIMMFLFVAMIHFPGAVTGGRRILWTIVIREMSFGGGSWVLAGIALDESRSAFSASAGTSRSSARETDAHVDSSSPLHRLSDGRIPHRRWRLLFAGAEDADSGHLSRRLDCAPGCGHLWACPDRVAGGPEYSGESRGAQLLRRHASIWRSDSFAGLAP
jgi:hypothetical protein